MRNVLLIIIFSLLSAPLSAQEQQSYCLENDPNRDQCQINFANQIDEQIAKLSIQDQKIISNLKGILTRGDKKKLKKIFHGGAVMKISDLNQRRFWIEVINIAYHYSKNRTPKERGLWFAMYISGWFIKDEQCLQKIEDEMNKNSHKLRLKAAKSQLDKHDNVMILSVCDISNQKNIYVYGRNIYTFGQAQDYFMARFWKAEIYGYTQGPSPKQ